MHILKSPYPEPPPLQDRNAHYALLNRPDQAHWPKDFTLHIDALTGQRRSFRDFLDRVNDLATALGASTSEGCLGLGKGDKIGIMMENSSDYINVIHSCLVNTIPFALISSYSTAFELKHALKLSHVTTIFAEARFLPLLVPVAQEIGFDTSKILVGHGSAPGRKNVEDLIKHVRTETIPFIGVKPARKNTLAYLVFSSGTSGLPKAVMISHGNLIYSLEQAAIMSMAALAVTILPQPATPEGLPVALAFLPLHHTYGLHSYTFRGFLAPMTMVFMKRWDIDIALASVPKYKVSIIGLIPSVVHQLAHHPKTLQTDWSTVTNIGSGAAYLPLELANKFTKMMPAGINFSQGYGMSEGTIAIMTQPFPGILGGKVKRIPGSTGILLPGLSARVVRDNGTDAALNETGELWVYGPSIALGYYNNEKANKEAFADGWLHTGDRFRVDADGNFWFADRAKDTLKVSGAQVSPMEIEDCLLAHPEKLIIDVTVAGVNGYGRTSDEKVPRAWIVLSTNGKKVGKDVAIKTLGKWIQQSLSKYKWVRGGFEIVDSIPKSPTGKVLRRILVDNYEKERGGQARSKL